MKQQQGKIIFFCAFFAAVTFLAAPTWADPVDQPVAIVTLYTTDAIPQSQFKATVKAMERAIGGRSMTLEEKKKLLDNLINEKLIIQAATKEKITVTEVEVNQYMTQTRKMYEERLGRPMTDEEFRTMVSQTGYSWDTFVSEIRKVLIEQKYIKNHKGAQLANVPAPTDGEIMDYFYQYQSRFASPEIVRFKQIYINPSLLATPAEKDGARKKAESISRAVKAGGSFDNYWEVYDDSGSVKIGSLINGMLRRDDDQTRKTFGDEFFKSVFALKQGEVSGVIASKAGYHIVMLLERFPAKLLGIDDLIPPQNSMTVRNYVKTILSKTKEQEAMQKALEEITNALQKTAVIKKFSDNLNW